MKFLPLGAELFHADGQADMANFLVVFRKLANAPKSDCTCYYQVNVQKVLSCFYVVVVSEGFRYGT